MLVAAARTAAPVALLVALAAEPVAELVCRVVPPDTPVAALIAMEAVLAQTQLQPVRNSQGFPVLTAHRCSQEESHRSLGS